MKTKVHYRCTDRGTGDPATRLDFEELDHAAERYFAKGPTQQAYKSAQIRYPAECDVYIAFCREHKLMVPAPELVMC